MGMSKPLVLTLVSLLVVVVAAGCSSSNQGTLTVTSTPAPVLGATPTPDASTSSNLELSSVSGVRNKLQALRVVDAPNASVPRYNRSDWKHWNDVDGDCINARHEVLIVESEEPVSMDGNCKVNGGYWVGLYTGRAFRRASDLDVDHMVPLANAHYSGGWAWDKSKKETYANFLDYSDHLIAVSASANRSKGASGPEDWKPDQRGYWCNYSVAWIDIKSAWDLSVTTSESIALSEMLGTCTGTVIETEPVVIPTSAPEQESKPPTNLKFDPFGPDRDCGDFSSWNVVKEFFIAAGGPGSDPHRLDGDRDGIPCESLR